MKHKEKTPKSLVKTMGKFNYWYGLHEVHYDKNGKENGYTEDSMVGAFESKADLVASLTLMLKDAKKKRPVLAYKP